MKTMLAEQMTLNTIASSDKFENGLGEYTKNNYAKALELLRPIAEEGNAIAQGLLGRMYFRGEGITQDYQEAAKWHHLAAEQGDKYSQHTLGSSYFYGVGVTKDYQEAAKWYHIAAEELPASPSQSDLNLLNIND
jgi:uncharacterized protein